MTVDQFCLKWNNYQVSWSPPPVQSYNYNYDILYIIHLYINTSSNNVKCPQASLTNAFKSLLENEDFVDVTLSAGGKTLRAHKVVLSACSSYFKQLLRGQYHTILDIQYTIFDNFSRPPNKIDKINVRRYFICVSLSWILFVSTCPVLLSLFVW